MLKNFLNKEVTITYEAGYSYFTKKGVITKVGTDFVMVDSDTIIAVKKIIKVVLKEKKKAKENEVY